MTATDSDSNVAGAGHLESPLARVAGAVWWLAPRTAVRLRLYALFLLVGVLLAAIGVLADTRDPSQACDSLPPKFGSGTIAFVDLDFRINTVRPNGCFQSQISDREGRYTWPTWSPDARQIVYAGQTMQGGVPGSLELRARSVSQEGSTRLFVSEPGMGPILPGMPYYPLWSPDSTKLSLMAGTLQGLTLLVLDPTVADSVEAAAVGSPLYAGWSADSTHMLVRVGVEHMLVRVEGGIRTEDLRLQTHVYRAPAWWPSGNRVVVVSLDESDKQVLDILDTETRTRTRLDEALEETAFLWSPSGEVLAVAGSQTPGDFLYEEVAFYSPDGSQLPLSIDETVVAFFWSPDSTKLAYVAGTQPPGALRWMVLDLTTGDRWQLVEFTPSSPQLTLFQFFDQFAYSHSMWSPDSRSLVFAGALASLATPASSGRQQASRIMVTEVRPSPNVTQLAEGSLAVWSPK